MIRGTVSEDDVPVIDVEVAGQRWSAMIDTGFNGELELPEALRSFVNAKPVGSVISILAADQIVKELAYLVDFPFDGKIFRAQATFVAGDQIRVGTYLLRDYQLRIDFPARTVTIDKG